jgi:hypothetical protein
MTLAEMDKEFGTGAAVCLGHAIAGLAKYAGHWWVLWARGWVRLDDEAVAAELDQIAEALTGSGDAVRQAVLSQTLTPEFLNPTARKD